MFKKSRYEVFFKMKKYLVICLIVVLLYGCESNDRSSKGPAPIDVQVAVIANANLKRIYSDPVRSAVYVSDVGNNAVHVIDTSTNSLVNSISVGSNPTKMDMDSNGQYLFVMNSGGSSVSVIDPDNQTLIHTINTSNIPDSIAVSSAGLLYVSFKSGVSPAVHGYDISTMPPTLSYTDNSSLIIVGRTSDYSRLYLHGWSTSLLTILWDVATSPPTAISSADVSSGAATITHVNNTNLVMVSPAFEYWATRWPSYNGDVPIVNGLVREATLNVEWTATAVASNFSGSEIAIAHGTSVTNTEIPVEDKHSPTPDLHIFSTNTYVEIERLIISDYILHNSLSYAANGNIYFLKGKSVSSSVHVVNR